jgi:hypothetical protein
MAVGTHLPGLAQVAYRFAPGLTVNLIHPTLPMNRRRLVSLGIGVVLAVWAVFTVARFTRQQQELALWHQRLDHLQTHPTKRATPPRETSEPVSPKLLKARAEVAGLHRELELQRGGSTTGQSTDGLGELADDSAELERLMKDRTPSALPGYRPKNSLRNRGFATPDDALETFWWTSAQPGGANPDVLDQLWWSPEDNAPEGYHYVIHFGIGVGNFSGYVVQARETVSDQEVLFRLGRQEGNSVVEETARYIQVGEQWRRKPEVRLVKDGE